jgi:hypothetical protein
VCWATRPGPVAGASGVDEKLVLVDQTQPVQFGRELAATEKHARWVVSLSFCSPVSNSPATMSTVGFGSPPA